MSNKIKSTFKFIITFYSFTYGIDNTFAKS